MMTSLNGNIFRVAGPLWGEFTGHRWIPLTKASDAELWCFLWSAQLRLNKQLSKPTKGWWFEMPSLCNDCCRLMEKLTIARDMQYKSFQTRFITSPHISSNFVKCTWSIKVFIWIGGKICDIVTEIDSTSVADFTNNHHLYVITKNVIMSAMVSQTTSLTIVYLTVSSGTYQKKHQSSASLAFVRGIHRWPVNSPHKGPETRKMSPFDDVIIFSVTTRLISIYTDCLSWSCTLTNSRIIKRCYSHSQLELSINT